MDDGFFGTLANLAFLHMGCIVKNNTTRTSRVWFAVFLCAISSGELVGEHLAYPQAWTCSRFFDNYIYDINIHSFFLHSLHWIACPSPSCFVFRHFLKVLCAGPALTPKLHPALCGSLPKGFEASKKSQMLAIFVGHVSVSIFANGMFQPG